MDRLSLRAPAQNEQLRKQGMRNRGHTDGRLGRPPRSSDPDYLQSYRRGAEARAQTVATTDSPPVAAA